MVNAGLAMATMDITMKAGTSRKTLMLEVVHQRKEDNGSV